MEFEIEQGPVLEHLGWPLGIVEAIVGQNRLELTFYGQSNHAGTTPMNLRHDALAAAAEWIVAVGRLARRAAGILGALGFGGGKAWGVRVVGGGGRTNLCIRAASGGAAKASVGELN